MGKEIARSSFSPADFDHFRERLAAETAEFECWWQQGRFDPAGAMVGFELEAWLVDRNFFPLPRNAEYLRRLGSGLVVPELSQFNVELNCTPRTLGGRCLRLLEDELARTWHECIRVAHEIDGQLAMIGILPTIRERDLTLANISARNRYYALNEQVLKSRGGRPLRLDISGREHLDLTHRDVMLEAATTSFQLHLQVPSGQIARYLNASMVLSAPLVALGANSPFLFERELWHETRIPLFEQAVDPLNSARPGKKRVTFGSGYLEEGPVGIFAENRDDYPVLLPVCFEEGAGRLPHLRLHNGTIWRWNRLLLGFDAQGTPQLRVEHRVLPAGPGLIDMIANAAVYIGATRVLAARPAPPEADLPFELARDNFYRAARHGLGARLHWLDGQEVAVSALLAEEILPMAREGLVALGAMTEDIDRYLDVAAARVGSGQNGAAWQIGYVDRHGRDFFRLTAAYLEQQRSGRPVHEWPL